MACGAAHSVCIAASGEVYSWGCGKYGRLGHGSEASEPQPRVVEALRGMRCVQIASGGAHNLALVSGENKKSEDNKDTGYRMRVLRVKMVCASYARIAAMRVLRLCAY